jgi:rubredoxin
MEEWECGTCGYIHRAEMGDPGQGVAPGTPWAEVPEDWRCPMCGTKKEDFILIKNGH